MKDETILFDNVIVAVSAGGNAFLISSPDEKLWNLMEGSLFEDNSAWDTMRLFPREPGVYRMIIEYEFSQGYSDGCPSDGESTWDFIPRNIEESMCFVSKGEFDRLLRRIATANLHGTKPDYKSIAEMMAIHILGIFDNLAEKMLYQTKSEQE